MGVEPRGSVQEEMRLRLQEGYGPGGQGPLPPIAVGFANCCVGPNTDGVGNPDTVCGDAPPDGPVVPPDSDGLGGSVWNAKMSECSGRENVFSGENNSQGFIVPIPPEDSCDSQICWRCRTIDL